VRGRDRRRPVREGRQAEARRPDARRARGAVGPAAGHLDLDGARGRAEPDPPLPRAGPPLRHPPGRLEHRRRRGDPAPPPLRRRLALLPPRRRRHLPLVRPGRPDPRAAAAARRARLAAGRVGRGPHRGRRGRLTGLERPDQRPAAARSAARRLASRVRRRDQRAADRGRRDVPRGRGQPPRRHDRAHLPPGAAGGRRAHRRRPRPSRGPGQLGPGHRRRGPRGGARARPAHRRPQGRHRGRAGPGAERPVPAVRRRGSAAGARTGRPARCCARRRQRRPRRPADRRAAAVGRGTRGDRRPRLRPGRRPRPEPGREGARTDLPGAAVRLRLRRLAAARAGSLGAPQAAQPVGRRPGRPADAGR
jgi:hypothetical protein